MFDFDGLSYNDIYEIQKTIEKAMCKALVYPEWMIDLHNSIVNFWENENLYVQEEVSEV